MTAAGPRIGLKLSVTACLLRPPAQDDKEPEPDAHGQGGYRFDTPEHQQQLKEQRVCSPLSLASTVLGWAQAR